MLHPQVSAVMHHVKSARLMSGPVPSRFSGRSIDAKLVVGPFPVASIRANAPMDGRSRLLRFGHQSQDFKMSRVGDQAGRGVTDLYARIVRGVLVLEVKASGNAGCAACRICRPCPVGVIAESVSRFTLRLIAF